MPKKQPQESKPEPRYLKPIPTSSNQKEYHALLKNEDKKIVLVDGYPGSGKSISAVYFACKAFLANKVKGIVLIRPNEGVGADIGFLPGNEYEKLSPKLKQLITYAECFTGMDAGFLIQSNIIMIQSLYNLQGMDLTGYYLIVDESQNINSKSMYCICTRGAEKIVINGDCHPSQVVGKGIKPGDDGLTFLINTLGDLDFVGHCSMDSTDDIVRKDYMKEIILRMTPKLN